MNPSCIPRQRLQPARQAIVLIAAIAVIVSGLFAVDAAPALASDTKKARKLLQKGDKYLRRADRRAQQGKGKRAKRYYQKALTNYQKAYKLVPKATIFMAIARAEAGLERHADAITHFQKVVAEVDDDALKREARQHIDKLKQHVAAVKFAIGPSGAALSIDGVPRGAAPIEGMVFLAPGRHTLTVTSEGYAPYEAKLDLGAGRESTQTIELRPSSAAASTLNTTTGTSATASRATVDKPAEPESKPAPEPAIRTRPKPGRESRSSSERRPRPVFDTERLPTLEESRKRRRRRLSVNQPGRGRMILGTTVTVGFLTGAAVTGLAALQKNDTFKDDDELRSARDDARDSGKSLALTTDILLAGATLAGAYTVYHYFTSYRPQKKAYEEHQRRRRDPTFLISGYVDGRGGGLAVLGHF